MKAKDIKKFALCLLAAVILTEAQHAETTRI